MQSSYEFIHKNTWSQVTVKFILQQNSRVIWFHYNLVLVGHGLSDAKNFGWEVPEKGKFLFTNVYYNHIILLEVQIFKKRDGIKLHTASRKSMLNVLQYKQWLSYTSPMITTWVVVNFEEGGGGCVYNQGALFLFFFLFLCHPLPFLFLNKPSFCLCMSIKFILFLHLTQKFIFLLVIFPQCNTTGPQ